MARLFGLKGLCKSAFRVHAQQQQPQQPGQQLVVGGLGQMDLAAIRELEALRDAFVPRPGNQRFRFHYLFLNVVDDPAQRVKPPGPRWVGKRGWKRPQTPEGCSHAALSTPGVCERHSNTHAVD